MAETTAPIQRALISVSNKTGLVEFCRSLTEEFNIEIISTGGTQKYIESIGVDGTPISAITGQGAVMEALDLLQS